MQLNYLQQDAEDILTKVHESTYGRASDATAGCLGTDATAIAGDGAKAGAGSSTSNRRSSSKGVDLRRSSSMGIDLGFKEVDMEDAEGLVAAANAGYELLSQSQRSVSQRGSGDDGVLGVLLHTGSQDVLGFSLGGVGGGNGAVEGGLLWGAFGGSSGWGDVLEGETFDAADDGSAWDLTEIEAEMLRRESQADLGGGIAAAAAAAAAAVAAGEGGGDAAAFEDMRDGEELSEKQETGEEQEMFDQPMVDQEFDQVDQEFDQELLPEADADLQLGGQEGAEEEQQGLGWEGVSEGDEQQQQQQQHQGQEGEGCGLAEEEMVATPPHQMQLAVAARAAAAVAGVVAAADKGAAAAAVASQSDDETAVAAVAREAAVDGVAAAAAGATAGGGRVVRREYLGMQKRPLVEDVEEGTGEVSYRKGG